MKGSGISLPVRILLGAMAGVLTGLLFGEKAAVVSFLGDAYVQLLVMCVYPYLIASLLHGLGKLDSRTSMRVFQQSWHFYLLAWGVSLVFILLLGFVFPLSGTPKVIIPTSGDVRMNLVDMLIPGNLIASLSSNYVPAIAICAVIFGLAIQRAKNKTAILEVTEQIKNACILIWNWIVYIAPIGVFALFAGASGTIKPAEINELLTYFVVFFIGVGVLAFLILPWLISAFTRFSPGKVIREVQSGMLLAIITNLSVVALPMINDIILKMSKEEGVADDNLAEVTGTQISLAYPFAQLGNLFVAFFILFSSFFYQIAFKVSDYFVLPFLTLLSTFGSPSSTVNSVQFLAEVFKLPDGTTQLFVSSSALTRFAQVAASVMGFTFAALLPTLGFYKKLMFRPPRLFVALLFLFLTPAILIIASKKLDPSLWQFHSPSYYQFSIPEKVKEEIPVSWKNRPDTKPSDRTIPENILMDIRKSGILRIGYYERSMPFCYRNLSGELVGYDVNMMYLLANDMNVRIEFVPYSITSLMTDLEKMRFDIAIGGVTVTPQRLTLANASDPYEISPFAVLARSTLALTLSDRESIIRDTTLRIGEFYNPIIKDFIKEYFPANPIIVISSYNEILKRPDIDILFWSLDKASAFARSHDGFSAVVPKNLGPPILMVYYMPRGADPWTDYINYWIGIKRIDGTTTELKDHWIDGNQPENGKKRWCLLHDVFHLM
jgi:Na+/H+-dicarboxylate symporter/ABC-type amino acid transport substrate-binding protein